MSDKKMICKSYQRYKSENWDYCSHCSVIFETTSKFLIVFARLILGEKGVDGVIEPRREIDIRYEFDLKIILKGSRFWMNFQATIKFVIVSDRLIVGKVGVDGITGPQRKSDVRQEMIFMSHQRHKDGNRDFCSHF